MSGPVAYFYTLLSVLSDRFEGRKERGATAVEYGLMVGLIAVVIICAVALLGHQISGIFFSVVKGLGMGKN